MPVFANFLVTKCYLLPFFVLHRLFSALNQVYRSFFRLFIGI